MLKITFLGTGTSVGVPKIGCDCPTCVSTDERDKRLRASILIEYNGKKILVDPSIDFRQQALRAKLFRIDAIFITHCHADHVFGLDDVRPINLKFGSIPCYASERTWQELYQIFGYIFKNQDSQHSRPQIVPHTLQGKFSIFGLEVTPLEVLHGKLPVTAFRLNNAAYVTDCKVIPPEALEALRCLDLLIIDGLSRKPHPTHLSLAESLEYINLLAPKRTLITHISHDLKHEEVNSELPQNVSLAYDGLEVTA
ncbi:MAG: MBL fold metallo-hydrolase [Acidobacteriota bacterium]|nr:MBL fold metallo-hydrolase [Blastocatellia bacterium]MDW8411485.1 MBL fold metallo-hydrolase [Acidobacteriota bacterium]